MAIGRPDWHSITTISGKYEDDFKPILLDSEGNLITHLRGWYGGASKDILLDAQGRIVAYLVGNLGGTPTPVALGTDGKIITVMQGDTGVVLKTVKVDGDGRMIGVMTGDFAGAVKTIALDTAGNMKANLVVQDLARLIMRVSQGPILEGDLGHVFGGVGSADILDISGAGTILGGFLMHTTGASHRTCSVRMSIDGEDFTTRKFETMMDYNTTDLYALPTRIIHYDDDNYRYIIGFVYGWSFDTGFKVRFSEAVGASTTVGAIYYSLIT